MIYKLFKIDTLKKYLLINLNKIIKIKLLK